MTRHCGHVSCNSLLLSSESSCSMKEPILLNKILLISASVRRLAHGIVSFCSLSTFLISQGISGLIASSRKDPWRSSPLLDWMEQIALLSIIIRLD